MKEKIIHRYSKTEEFLNIATHGLGLLLSVVALPFLIIRSFNFDGFLKPFSFIVYGCSLIILYAASTFYHAAKQDKLRRRLNIFDHAAIYVLIAGTYTPFTIIVLEGATGWVIFGLTWFFALTGIILKLFFTGKYDRLSTIMYVLMGWQIVFAIKPLLNSLPTEGLQLLIWGGVFYTVGAILYSIKKIPYNHAIFHVFVLLGSASHFLCIYYHIS
ncbi:hemolysin III family protein [Flavobacteriaceae bacterium S356]|uniref:Hemolysin III family protein n=1 Tax=Asprobacillus argus TaxID=3076534 RepID=A0ABU3LBN8_9FLAO|nr:hemolysin III family protein [Flavobacteriaceae bacterium S356]